MFLANTFIESSIANEIPMMEENPLRRLKLVFNVLRVFSEDDGVYFSCMTWCPCLAIFLFSSLAH